MATIIKLPDTPELAEDQEATCYSCRCVFSYSRREITTESKSLDGGWGGVGITRRVNCPNCGYNQTVGVDYIPPR